MKPVQDFTEKYMKYIISKKFGKEKLNIKLINEKERKDINA